MKKKSPRPKQENKKNRASEVRVARAPLRLFISSSQWPVPTPKQLSGFFGQELLQHLEVLKLGYILARSGRAAVFFTLQVCKSLTPYAPPDNDLLHSILYQ